MDLPTLFSRTKPISIFRGVGIFLLFFFQIVKKHSVTANIEDPDQTLHNVASDLFCTVCLMGLSI